MSKYTDQDIIEETGIYGVPGEIIEFRKGEGIVVSGARGKLLITRLEPEDSAEMWADDFAQGYGISVGATFTGFK